MVAKSLQGMPYTFVFHSLSTCLSAELRVGKNTSGQETARMEQIANKLM
jgi:hypothetical protein